MKEDIERLFGLDSELLLSDKNSFEVFNEFKKGLNQGTIRAAEKREGKWVVNGWVKKGILLGFRLGKMKKFESGQFRFYDKDTYPLKSISEHDGVRFVPGGSGVRDGSYLAESVVIMPPSYINVGAYVDSGTMVDSHALVGSCAQIGKNVHLSACAQIGGVLEPVGAMPVIIEDHVMVGGNCGVYEGIVVKEGAVLGTGVILNASTPVYDLVNKTVLRKTEDSNLVIPENAVLIPGARHVKSAFGKEEGLSIYTPVIVKYKDEKTQTSISLEDILR